jgi:hypothetical protein
MIICGERTWWGKKGDTWFSQRVHLPVTHESEYVGGLGTQRTENMVQTNANANKSGPSWTEVTRRPMPMMEKGAADSMSIAAILVYIPDDVAGPSTCRKSARIRRRRKQIIEVTMMFKLTLREIHWIPF